MQILTSHRQFRIGGGAEISAEGEVAVLCACGNQRLKATLDNIVFMGASSWVAGCAERLAGSIAMRFGRRDSQSG